MVDQILVFLKDHSRLVGHLLVLLEHLYHLYWNDRQNLLFHQDHLYSTLLLNYPDFLYPCRHDHGNYYLVYDCLLYRNLPCLCHGNHYFHHLYYLLLVGHLSLEVEDHLQDHQPFLVLEDLQVENGHVLLYLEDRLCLLCQEAHLAFRHQVHCLDLLASYYLLWVDHPFLYLQNHHDLSLDHQGHHDL